MNGKLEYYKTTKGNTTRFKFFYKGWNYFGWVCPDTEEFKINRENKKSIETLGWSYYVPDHTNDNDESCVTCTANTCCDCPSANLEQAGWDYEDLQEFLQKVKF